jgi:hypothetical protein
MIIDPFVSELLHGGHGQPGRGCSQECHGMADEGTLEAEIEENSYTGQCRKHGDGFARRDPLSEDQGREESREGRVGKEEHHGGGDGNEVNSRDKAEESDGSGDPSYE